MKLLNSLLVAAVTATFDVTADSYFGSDLAACNSFVAHFDNTCDLAALPETFDVMPYVTVSCTGTGGCTDSVGGTYDAGTDVCTWRRKLCVSCSETGGKVYIRVRSNGLPHTCFNTGNTSTKIKEWFVDYSVIFNLKREETAVFNVDVGDDQEKYSEVVCLPKSINQSEMPQDNQYTQLGSNLLDRVTGVSLTGVVLTSGSAQNTDNDAFYPREWEGPEIGNSMIDSCLGFTDERGMYSYKYTSPCLHEFSTAGVGGECATCFCPDGGSDNSCEDGLKQYLDKKILSGLLINGIAKDGHVIYGKENKAGLVTGCDVDACNGAWVESGIYAYFATEFHPYGPGCWGPANIPDEIMRPQVCSWNGRVCGALKSLGYSLFTTLTILTLF